MLLDGLRSGQLRAFTFSYMLYSLLLRPNATTKYTKGFQEAARKNPPIKLTGSYDQGFELLRHDTFLGSPKHVWLIWQHEEAILLSKFCGLHISRVR